MLTRRNKISSVFLSSSAVGLSLYHITTGKTFKYYASWAWPKGTPGLFSYLGQSFCVFIANYDIGYRFFHRCPPVSFLKIINYVIVTINIRKSYYKNKTKRLDTETAKAAGLIPSVSTKVRIVILWK